MEELPDDKSDIFQNGLIGCHMKWPTTGQIKQKCLALFAVYCYKKIVEQKDSQSFQLPECDTEDFTVTLPKVTKLESSSETWKKKF